MNYIIITGCTSGVGRAFHDNINSLISSDTQCIFLGRELQRIIKNTSHVYYEIDLSQESEIDWSGVFFLGNIKNITFISNAGIIQPLGKITVDKYDLLNASTNINLISPVKLISSLVLWSKKNKLNLKVINVTSGAALRPIAGWATYCMTKAGMRMFLDVVAMEHEHVEIIHFDPGVIDTNMQKSIRSANVQDFPNVDRFIEFAGKGQLRSAIDVATELAKMCETTL